MNRRRLEKLKAALCEPVSAGGAKLADVVKALETAGFDVRRGSKSTHFIAQHDRLDHPLFVNGTLSFAEKKGTVKSLYVRRVCFARDWLSIQELDDE